MLAVKCVQGQHFCELSVVCILKIAAVIDLCPMLFVFFSASFQNTAAEADEIPLTVTNRLPVFLLRDLDVLRVTAVRGVGIVFCHKITSV